MNTTYKCVLADPAWSFNDKLPGPSRGSAKNYDVMSVDDIMNLELPPIDKDAYLFLWRVSSQVEEAYRVARAWGFTPKSEIVWIKKTSKGKRWFGMGRHVRAEHETCIVATRGRPLRLNANTRSTFEAPVGKHSAKPEAFYDIVESLCPGPRVELFARRPRTGWTSLGGDLGHELRVKTR